MPGFDIRTRKVPGVGRLYIVGVQPRKGGPYMRVSSPVLAEAIREAVAQAWGQG
jgi:hypothetical protein